LSSLSSTTRITPRCANGGPAPGSALAAAFALLLGVVPALVLLVRLDQHTAIGTSLGALLLPVGLLAVLEYHRRGQVHVPYAALLAGGLLVGALIGAKFAGDVSGVVLRLGFGVLLLLVSV